MKDCDNQVEWGEVKTTKWKWSNGDYVEIDQTEYGYLLGGRFPTLPKYDDIICRTADDLLDELKSRGLLKLLGPVSA